MLGIFIAVQLERQTPGKIETRCRPSSNAYDGIHICPVPWLMQEPVQWALGRRCVGEVLVRKEGLAKIT